MNRSPSPVLFLLALLLLGGGFALGFVLGDAPSVAAAPGTAGGGLAVVPAQSAPAAAAGPAQVSPARAKAGEGELPPMAVSRSSGWSDSIVEGAQAEVAAHSYPTGQGEIRGRVKTVDGEPLTGVLIRAQQRRESRSIPPPSSRPGVAPSAEDELRRQLSSLYESYYRGKRTLREARTGADGTFVLRGIADVAYSLQAFLPGFEIAIDRSSASSRISAGDVVDFIATPLVGIACTLVLPGGAEPELGTIRWELQSGNRRNSGSEPWRPNAREIYLREGCYQISARREGTAPCFSAPQSLVVERGSAPAPLVFQLQPYLSIQGRILSAAGEELARRSLRIVALRYSGEQSPTLEEARGRGQRAEIRRRSGSWAYEFPRLRPGKYMLGLYVDDRKASPGETVELVDRAIQKDLHLSGADDRKQLTLWVRGPQGQLLSDYDVRIRYRSARGGRSISTRLVHRSDGSSRVLLSKPRSTSTPPLEYFLRVRSARFGSAEVAFDPEATRELTVSFQAPALLEVTLAKISSGAATEGNVGLRLEAKNAQGDSRSMRDLGFRPRSNRSFDASGKQLLGPVQPGPYVLVAEIGSQPWSRIPALRQDLELSSGLNKTTLSLPPLYNVTIRVPGLTRGSISLRAEAGGRRWYGGKSLDSEGKVRFGPLPAGTYTADLSHPEQSGSMQILVPGPAEVTFVARPRKPVDALRIQVEDSGGYLAGLGLHSGDLLVALNGVKFKDYRQMISLYSGALALLKDQVTLTILRGGSTISVKADPARLRAAARIGGALKPSPR